MMYRCLAIALLFFSFPALSAETRPFMYRVQQTAQLQELINRGSVPVTYETVATTPQGQQVTRYTNRNTVINATRLGSIARTAVGGPAVLAATAAFLAYDYFYNEETDTWEVEQANAIPDTPAGSCSYGSPASVDLSTCYNRWLALTHPTHLPLSIVQGSLSNQLAFRRSDGARTGYWQGPGGYVFPESLPFTPSESVPATDEDLGNAIKSAPPQAVSDILNDPISTGTWPDRWPEMVPTVQDIKDNLGHEIEGAPAPSNPDQTIRDGSTARPSGSGSGSGSGLPPFCNWAPAWLCNLMDLPENPEVPFVDIDEPDDFNSGIGAGSCPPDIMISLGNYGSVPISWEYPCELASTFKPVVLFFAWITALYIVVRVK